MSALVLDFVCTVCRATSRVCCRHARSGTRPFKATTIEAGLVQDGGFWGPLLLHFGLPPMAQQLQLPTTSYTLLVEYLGLNEAKDLLDTRMLSVKDLREHVSSLYDDFETETLEQENLTKKPPPPSFKENLSLALQLVQLRKRLQVRRRTHTHTHPPLSATLVLCCVHTCAIV